MKYLPSSSQLLKLLWYYGIQINYFFPLFREVTTTGSILDISQDFDDENDLNLEEVNADQVLNVNVLGQPVRNFAGLAEKLMAIDDTGFVKKKIIEEGGGLPLHEGCTVSIAFSGYWENVQEPFDAVPLKRPMVR